MRILWWSAHPDMPTGYGTQTALLLPRLQALGHEVAVAVTAGQDSHTGWWQGIPVFPKTPYTDHGEDVIQGHYAQFKADLLISFFCTWIMKQPQLCRDMRTVHLNPVDCDPMSLMDYQVIADTGGMPAAVSEFGLRVMRAGGIGREPLDPLYLPHGIDTTLFRPPVNRDGLRASMNLDDRFVVGMNFMNNDRERKGINECLQSFAVFHATHPDALLALHAIKNADPNGFNLPALCAMAGIEGAVMFSPQYELLCGMVPPPAVADWYGALDVLLSPGNEGFGLPAVEAQSCGTPVILGDWSTGPELVGPGWLVAGQRRYNNAHKAFWHTPFITSIVDALESAYEDAANRRDAARDNATAHDIDAVVREHWEPVLGDLG